jgi:hypothetical protein
VPAFVLARVVTGLAVLVPGTGEGVVRLEVASPASELAVPVTWVVAEVTAPVTPAVRGLVLGAAGVVAVVGAGSDDVAEGALEVAELVTGA